MKHCEKTVSRHTDAILRFEAFLQRSSIQVELQTLLVASEVVDKLVYAFGQELYASEEPYYKFIYLITGLQHRFPCLKRNLAISWDLAKLWQIIEPTIHRVPVPEEVMLAMFSNAVLRGWYVFAALLGIMFYGTFRPIEVVGSLRANLILPVDILKNSFEVLFLRVLKPKSGLRGGAREQYGSVRVPWLIEFVHEVFNSLSPQGNLWPHHPRYFNTKWTKLLALLDIPKGLFTPGGVRGGGAVWHFQTFRDIHRLLWDMRLQNQTTLEHYLQEVAVGTSLTKLSAESRKRVANLSSAAPALAKALSVHLSKGSGGRSFREVLCSIAS
jgi:hypothetical protein